MFMMMMMMMTSGPSLPVVTRWQTVQF